MKRSYRRPDAAQLAADRWMVDIIRGVLGKDPLYNTEKPKLAKTYPDPDTRSVDGCRQVRAR